jgi:hypothetical protein
MYLQKVSGAGSIGQRQRSADPDPYQNVKDPPTLFRFLIDLLFVSRCGVEELRHVTSPLECEETNVLMKERARGMPGTRFPISAG